MYNAGFTYDDKRVIQATILKETGLCRHGFSTRKGGVSGGRFQSLNLGMYTEDEPENIRQNFSAFCEDIHIKTDNLILLKQVHSTKVLTVSKKDKGKGFFTPGDLGEADGLITNEPGLCLASFYADCTPFLFLDPVNRVVASVHSGWRGTLGKIAGVCLSQMEKQFGSNPANVLVATGPSIKQCHFEVGEEVYSQFVREFSTLAQKHTVKKDNKYYIDTDAINRETLLAGGVQNKHISMCPLCTYCHEDLFFSHRREGDTGRMCAMIELT